MKYLEDLKPGIATAYLRSFRNKTDAVPVCPRCVYIMQNKDRLYFACDSHYIESSRRFGRMLFYALWRGGMSYIIDSSRGNRDGDTQKLPEFIRSITQLRAGDNDIGLSILAAERAISSKVWGDCSHLGVIVNLKSPRIVSVTVPEDAMLSMPRIDALLEIFPPEHFSIHNTYNPHLAVYGHTVYREDRMASATSCSRKGQTVDFSLPIPPYYYMDIFGYKRGAMPEELVGAERPETIITELEDEDDDEEHVDEALPDMNREDD